MTINTIDTTTPLVGLKAGAEVYNANFTDANNAASKEVGTLPAQVPTNADLGTASLADIGTAAGNVPTNGDLGSASTKDTGTAAGQIPLNSDLGTAATKDVGTSLENVLSASNLPSNGGSLYDDSNLNTVVFRGTAVGDKIAIGYSTSPSTAEFYLPTDSFTDPVSISLTSVFSVREAWGNALVSSGVSPTLSGTSSNKLCVINVSGLSGLTANTNLVLSLDSNSSRIDVNY